MIEKVTTRQVAVYMTDAEILECNNMVVIANTQRNRKYNKVSRNQFIRDAIKEKCEGVLKNTLEYRRYIGVVE